MLNLMAVSLLTSGSFGLHFAFGDMFANKPVGRKPVLASMSPQQESNLKKKQTTLPWMP